MPMDALSDYHRTIYRRKTESKLMMRIGFGLGGLGNLGKTYPFKYPLIFSRAWKAFPFLVWDMMQYKKGKVDYDRIYSRFNNMLLRKGVPEELILKIADKFADDVRSSPNEIDANLLDILRDQKNRGSKVGIFSTGYGRVIERVFNYTPGVPGLDFLEANDFVVEDGIIYRFELKHFDDRELFPQIAEGHDFDIKNSAYVADDVEKDAPCFEAVGLPVLSNYADEESRAIFMERYPHGISLKDHGYDAFRNRILE